MKEYAVSVLPKGQKIEFDSLPVAKITHYPLEKHAYKPYAQAVLAFEEDRLGLRVASFEASPNDDSLFEAVFYLYPDMKNDYLDILATPHGITVSLNGKISVAHTAHTHNGEDLQGVYWGYDIFISLEVLNLHSRVVGIEDGTFKGNFFKIQNSEPSHYGSFNLAEFKDEVPVHKEKMSILKLVEY